MIPQRTRLPRPTSRANRSRSRRQACDFLVVNWTGRPDVPGLGRLLKSYGAKPSWCRIRGGGAARSGRGHCTRRRRALQAVIDPKRLDADQRFDADQHFDAAARLLDRRRHAPNGTQSMDAP